MSLILVLLASIGIFYIAREIIKSCRECDDKEAEKIIFSCFFGGAKMNLLIVMNWEGN